VINMAIAAATEDPRFPQVTLEELDDIKIEISVLSPLKRVFSHKEIKEKVHGVVVRSGGKSGLFLPQVWEQLPKKEQFLSELCWGKAGLPPNAWQDPKTELYVFTVFAFEEHK
ncbi:MAG: AmmeMemoRadiSam system protein A, partial [Endomicrobia bacterium]|nr:AmmeMemoRadiSam system protein A [Endomicrobiia bacterium]